MALRTLTFGLRYFAAVSLLAGSVSAAEPWTPQISVSLRQIVRSQQNPESWAAKGTPFLISPDGDRLAVVLHWGDAGADEEVYWLGIFSSNQIEECLRPDAGVSAPEPLRHFEMRSRISRSASAAIRKIEWLDNDRIAFLGTGEDRERHALFIYDVPTRKLTRISSSDHDVDFFTIVDESFAYTAMRYQSRKRDQLQMPAEMDWYPARAVRSGELEKILRNSAYDEKEVAFFGGKIGGEVMEIAGFERSFTKQEPFVPFISKGGAFVLAPAAFRNNDEVIGEWERYLGKPLETFSDKELLRLRRLTIFDPASGERHTVADMLAGPAWDMMQQGDNLVAAEFSPNQNLLLLANVVSQTARERSGADVGQVAVYDIQRRAGCLLGPTTERDQSGTVCSFLQEIAWIDNRTITLTRKLVSNGDIQTSVYRREAVGWVETSRLSFPAESRPPPAPRSLRGEIALEIEESRNEPFRLVALRGNARCVLLGEDPALAGVRFSRSIEIEWRERNGVPVKGDLILPEKYDAARPLPLVIQLQERNPDRFLPDGEGATAYAAQSLAAQGFAVLLVDFRVFENHDSSQFRMTAPWMEGVLTVERIDAAVERLASLGYVDPRRVGLVGFSHTGAQVYYAITHPQKVVPAAAIIAHSATVSYGEYVYLSALTTDPRGDWISRAYEKQYGGSFWSAQARWLEHAPAFNVHKCETPALFFDMYSTPLSMLETVGVFKLARREMDTLLFAAGSHQLRRPMQRIAGMQATVSWMAFWLQDRELAEASESLRYWRLLKLQRDTRWSIEGNPSAKAAKTQGGGAAIAGPK
jgi:dipeptidyl aminopeptidase/acylaminoacyl peptidase